MKELKFVDKLIELKILTDRISWGFGENKSLFSLKYQILFLVGKKNMHSPKELIFNLNLAKSNIALICNELCKESFLTKKKSEKNKKEIGYFITKKGQELLNNKLDDLEIKVSNETELAKNLESVIEKLKELK